MIKMAAGTFDFGTVANRYDKWYETAQGTVYDRIEKHAVGRTLPDIRHGNQMLEIGCGTGHWSRFFSERGFRVTGIDISPEMVNVARSKGIENASFYVADATSLPFPDDSFDIAVAVTVLEFVAEPDRMLHEMARCVRHGGRLVIGALNRHSILGIQRRARPSELFSSAKMFTRSELYELLSDVGRATVRTVAFVVPWRWLLWTAPVLDLIGRGAHLPWGDFMVGEVRI
ncbi:MAG: class I SAM-dependent methyltransferase [Candidatus Hydrogenedentes bacterium]|nr:class I SAM-dependent methyltransferase [Candidatus Hydrogenedentota bacterium]